MAGILENVGIIDGFGKLTDGAKKAIVERINDAQSEGTDKSPPVDQQHRLPDDILDEKKYPDFHKEVIGAYEGAVNALNLPGNFSLPPPFIDPLALATKLNPDLNINFDYANLPSLNPITLGLMIEVTPIELITKLILPPTDADAIIKPPIPNFSLPSYMPDPGYLKDLENISSPFPAVGFTQPFLDKIEFDLWKSPQVGMPKAFGEVLKQIIQDPAKIIGLVSPEPNLDFAIEAIQKSGIFGKSDEGEVTKSVIQQDIAKYVGQATGVVALGMTIGDGGPNGGTGLCAGGSRLIITETKIQDVEFTSSDQGGQRMIKAVTMFLASPNELLNDTNAQFAGSLSIGEAGAVFPHFILRDGYGSGETPTLTINKTVATSCGELPAACLDVMLGSQWTHGNPKGRATMAGKEASGENLPYPFAMVSGEHERPAIKLSNSHIPQGPAGILAFGKALGALVESNTFELPKPGDIYFLNNIDHVGIIVGGQAGIGTPIGILDEYIYTADAGQGLAGRPKNKEYKHPHGTAVMTNNEAATKEDMQHGGGVGMSGGKLINSGKGWFVARATVEPGAPGYDAIVQTQEKAAHEGIKSAQTTAWSRRKWVPGSPNPRDGDEVRKSGNTKLITRYALLGGSFGEGADTNGAGTPAPGSEEAAAAPRVRPQKELTAWISMTKLLEVIGGACTSADPEKKAKYIKRVELAYKTAWGLDAQKQSTQAAPAK